MATGADGLTKLLASMTEDTYRFSEELDVTMNRLLVWQTGHVIAMGVLRRLCPAADPLTIFKIVKEHLKVDSQQTLEERLEGARSVLRALGLGQKEGM